MKLFVYKDFFPDYTSGLAVAIADSEPEAKKMIMDKYYNELKEFAGLEMDENIDKWFGEATIFELDKKMAVAQTGGQ